MAKKMIDLTKKKPRETSGASSANRFSYQVNWAFLKLIELHKAGQEYLIVLDYHDDVVIANSETAPTRVDFYQVKTSRKKDWSEARLVYRKTHGSLSILGKLYDHKLNFPDNDGKLGFVSHKHCGLAMPDEMKLQQIVPFSNLNAECKTTLLQKIRDEHSLPADPNCDDAIVFIVSPLRIETYTKDLKSELIEYTDGLVPSGEYPVTKLYLVIADAMRQQNDNEDSPRSMEELVAKKSIARSKVQTIIDRMMPSDRYQSIWLKIPVSDFGPNIGMGPRRRIGEGFTRYAAHKQDGTNRVGKTVGQAIRNALSVINANSINTLEELFNVLMPQLTALPTSADESYVKGAIILEWYDNGNDQLPATDPKSSGAAA